MHPRHEAALKRFLEVAKADDRLVAVALLGSHVSGTADEHSDLDLCLVTEDSAFEEFIAGRDTFLASVAAPLFIESWGHADRWCFVFAGGCDGDLMVVPAGSVQEALDGPFLPLLDKRGVLSGVGVTAAEIQRFGPEQSADIQRRLTGFWHDYAHFLTAWHRGQWWWANGQLEILRGMCANLLRLAANPSDPDVGEEPYWKIELTLSAGDLARLEPTLNTLEPASMLVAGRALARVYSEAGHQLADSHGLAYPEEFERLVLARLEGHPGDEQRV